MDFVTRRHENYRELVRVGVMCGALRSFGRMVARWELECQIVGDISKDEAKRAVERYVRTEWEGQDFQYFTTPQSKPGKFKVRFTSWVL